MATPSSLGERADLPNTQKQTQSQAKIKKTEYVSIKRTRQDLPKRTKRNEISNLPDRIQNNGHKGAH